MKTRTTTKLTTHKPLLQVLAVLALTMPFQSTANLISNGSFESPTGSPGLNSFLPTDWSLVGNTVNLVINDGFPNYPAPQDGNQYVNLGSATLSHSFTVGAAGDHTLSWFINSFVSGNNGSYLVSVTDSSAATIFSQAYAYIVGGGVWDEHTVNLPGLAPGNYTLTLGSATTFTFLDNVSINPTHSPVPDSGSTFGFLICALAGYGFIASKRRPAVLRD